MATAKWFVQGNKRAKGLYYEAVYRNPGGKGRTVALGYISEEQVVWAKDNLRVFGDAFLKLDGFGGPSYTADEIRLALLRDPLEAVAATKEAVQHVDRVNLAAGDYAKLDLRAFFEQVWVNVRPKDVAPGTWHREQWFWTAKILPVLGSVKLPKLDAVKWATFLSGLENCGGKTKAIIQGCYRALLRYCVEVEILPVMHGFRDIKGSKTRTLPRPKPLLIHEVAALLDHAPTAMHRSLYATAIGQGLRPGEVGTIRWEDVDWAKKTLYVRGTKTDLSEDTVPLTNLTRVELARWWEACGRPTTGHVYTWGGTPIVQWRNGFKTAAKKAGIADGRRVFANLCRHTFCTLAAMGKIPKPATKRMMRHSHASEMVDTAYTHPQVEQVAEAMADFPELPAAKVIRLPSRGRNKKAS